jgi:sodium pump decarboxylase gamma subunit
MDMTSLLKNFADPELIKTMATGDLLTGVLVTLILGMGITFTVLIILMFSIQALEKIFAPKPPAPVKNVKVPDPDTTAAESDDNELVAVIVTAVAAAIGTTVDNLKVKNILRVGNNTPVWNKTGITDQMMNNRF